jgi:tRNA(Ser,Leu) C12 N-acetylase TAN1
MQSEGSTGRIDFEDPDVIIVVETVGQIAGLSLWTREQRRKYSLLRLD